MQYCKNIYKAVRKVYKILQEPCNVRSKHYKWNIAAILYHCNIAVIWELSSSFICSSWTGFWFWNKLCETTPNSVGIFKTQSVTFVIDFASGILILILKKKSEKILWTKTEFHEHHQRVKHNFIINDYEKLYPDPDRDRNLTESKNGLKLID